MFGCVALAALTVFLLFGRASRIHREHFEALREGMTRAEVERLLGGPARNECSDPADVWVPRPGGKARSAEVVPGPVTVRFFPEAAVGAAEAVWVGRSGLIAARFGGDDRLVEKYFSTVHPRERPTLAGALARSFGQ
jgi:hypothetical protein